MYTEFTGNPHQDRNPWKSFTGGFGQGWGDRRPPAIPLPIDVKDRGGTPAVPLPIDVKDRGGIPAIPLPNPFSGGFQQGWGSLGPLAELTQKQKDFMGSPYNTPDFGVSKKELWDKTKGMEKKGFFGWGAQEPTTIQEFNDYYNQLEQGKAGNWLAMNKGLDNWGGNLKGTFDQPGYGDPSSLDPWGNDWGRGYIPDYNYDPYDDDVLDPGFGDHPIGPLYFG